MMRIGSELPMKVSTRRWLSDLAGTMAKLAPDQATALDLQAVTEAALALGDGGPEEEVETEELELAGDFLLDVEETRAAWLERCVADDPVCKDALDRFHAAFRRDAPADVVASRIEAVKSLVEAAGEALARRLVQLRWARERRERRTDERHLPLLPNQPGPGEDGWTRAAADEAATRAASELRTSLSPEARRALVELLRAPSEPAGAIAARHGISGATVSRAKTRLGHVAARILREYPDGVRGPFWSALREALA